MKAAKGTAKVQPKAGPASLNEKLKTWIKQEGLHDTADPDGADAESTNVDPQKSLKYNKMKDKNALPEYIIDFIEKKPKSLEIREKAKVG